MCLYANYANAAAVCLQKFSQTCLASLEPVKALGQSCLNPVRWIQAIHVEPLECEACLFQIHKQEQMSNSTCKVCCSPEGSAAMRSEQVAFKLYCRRQSSCWSCRLPAKPSLFCQSMPRPHETSEWTEFGCLSTMTGRSSGFLD